ncbi:MAG: Gfo/Idh/MocA family oxidoreductase [Butyricicoccus sp.]|nr:Gfo/Idh/MocA family oxidoreductase [Butyricicoccus sp.]
MKKLTFGMVGGGQGAFIGEIHRRGVLLNDLAEMKAGCFSRSYDKSLKTAEAWSIAPERVYRTYQEMAEAEAGREDGIDFVIIVTPNVSHYEIAKCFMEHDIHVMCDKPLAMTTEQAEELQTIAKEREIQFGMTYTYTGYPIIRQAREMIRNGAIGDIVHVRVQHPEDWVIESVSPEQEKDAKLPWRFDPACVGSALCTGDLATHAEQMLVQFTGLHVKRVLAMFDTYPKYLSLETNTTVLLDLGDGIQGELWASQIAIGKPCAAGIYVIGTEGALEWNHETPSILRYTKRNGTTQLLEAGREYTYQESSRLCYASVGHHDGFNEAFGTIYRSYCEVLLAKKENREPENYTFPTIDDGVDGMRFVEACVESHKKGNVWVDVRK